LLQKVREVDMAEYFDDWTGMFWVDEQWQRRGHGPKEDPIVQLRKRLQGFTFNDTYDNPPLCDPPAYAVVAFDTETDDPDLLTKGSSWAFGTGEIIGFSVAWTGYKAYYPLRHCGGNVDPDPPLRWLASQVKREDLTWVMAHANYDVGWVFRETGQYPAGKIVDVQHMAALLDENEFSYSLEAISMRCLGYGKETDRLKQLEEQFACKHTTMMASLKFLPGPVVANYAETDAERTLQCYYSMLPKIQEEGLTTIFDLECDLITSAVDMKRLGLRVNVDRAQWLSEDIQKRRMPETVDEIKRITGITVSPWQADSCYAALTEAGVQGIKKTANGSWQINTELLAVQAKTTPVAKHILDLRKMSKISGTFIDGHILYYANNGRLHASFNQLRSESDNEQGGVGTVTGRWSASDPALQQIPVRDPEWGPEIRSLFLPEEGEEFLSVDYSSQEPRMAVHFAYKAGIRGSRDAVAQFRANPRTDYHQMVADFSGLKRDRAKTLNLGLAYGMKQAKMARALGLPTQWMRLEKINGSRTNWIPISYSEINRWRSEGQQCVEVAGEEAKAILKKWKEGAPFLTGLFEECEDIAKERGYICTLLKRRCRFVNVGMGVMIDTYKAMNRLCQSSSADQTKKAMSLLKAEKIPMKLTLHDELLFSISDRAITDRIKEIMEHAIELVIPSVVDAKYGKDWGSIPKT
jgi:DNA polymerase I-like protein with 3'-5' exonuclease and polymerase domains